MTLTGSLSNALSGLTAASKAAQVVSSNVANATTEGYATRVLNTSAASLGGVGAGVRIDGVQRQVDAAVVAERREAGAENAHNGVVAEYYARVEGILGLPADAGSLNAALVQFETALIDAASRPDQTVRLDAAVAAAVNLADRLKDAAAGVQQERSMADREIGQQIETLNTALHAISELNKEISKARVAGLDVLSLFDQRQTQIDLVSGIVPVTVLPRDNDQIALISTGGGVLLDGRPSTLEFSTTHAISADMTVQSGGLAQPTLNGEAVDLSLRTNMLQGGSLQALFAVRDSLAPENQAALDAMAAELISRFEDPAVDASLAAGVPGLFTDAGSVFDPLNEVGLASRLSVNAGVDTGQGGESWRIRDGVGQTVPGPVGNASQLLGFVDVLSDSRVPASANASTEPRTVFSLLSDLVSDASRLREQADNQRATSNATWEAWRSVELEGGVDTDAEIQRLLLIEQAYAANAKVIEAVETMLDALTRI
ncbi:MAG: flagellar hook-associated protein FlgK [Pseudomonadota bacterium]